MEKTHQKETKLYSKIEDKVVLFGILIIAIVLRLLLLEKIPGEMWGDAITHNELAISIGQGNYFLNYNFGGDGPFFSYLTGFLGKLLGYNFIMLKIATSIGGVFLTYGVYLFSKELFKNKKLAFISAFLTAVSFWSISFSRQAKPHIFVPVFVMFCLYFALKNKIFLAGLFLGLGMYVQAGFWGTLLVFWRRFRILVIGILISIPTMHYFFTRPNGFFSPSGFYGEKLQVSKHLTLIDYAVILLNNIWKNCVSFNFIGDAVFRHNIPNHPHLDVISGLFFIAGLLLIIKQIIKHKDMRLLEFFLIPFIFIQLPSVADIGNPQSIPSMGRMIGIIPFMYITVAYGIDSVSNRLNIPALKVGFLAAALVAIMSLNIYNYFVVYPKTLPNKNVPYGQLIAKHLDKTYSTQAQLYLRGCCWGAWGQPELGGIKFVTQKQFAIEYLDPEKDLEQLLCQPRSKVDTVILMSDPAKEQEKITLSCSTNIKEKILKAEGKPLVRFTEIYFNE